jgi:mannitol/fructose-specific phosphotransferase system IIA component (Ntr-type)
MSTSTHHLTIGEVANHFGWSPRFIDSLIRTDRIPGVVIAGEPRFEREALIDWLEEKLRQLDHEQVVALDNHLAGPEPDDAEFDPITLQLSKQGIRWDHPAIEQSEVLAGLVDFAVATDALTDPAVLLASLVERERLCSTALPGGVAICHPRQPLPGTIWKPFIRLIRTGTPVSFGAEDLQPTRLFFLLGATSDSGHLQALARLARILDDTTKTALLNAPSADAAYQIIAGREVTIHRRRQTWVADDSDAYFIGDE